MNGKLLVVCGPTASGKSDLSDNIAHYASEHCGAWVPTAVLDSMQVYREIPKITNQARSRPAELTGIVSVSEQWTVADHKHRTDKILQQATTPVVLDAGTGMYLNIILLNVPLAPKVGSDIRERAEKLVSGALDPRRRSRELELKMYGARDRDSIWDGGLRHKTAVIYLRPDRRTIDQAIAVRSRRIVSEGLEEAEILMNMVEPGRKPNKSVSVSIGVQELTTYLAGDLSREEALEKIETRTRQLARRQMRWFDKLCKRISTRATVKVVDSPNQVSLKHTLHDMIDP